MTPALHWSEVKANFTDSFISQHLFNYGFHLSLMKSSMTKEWVSLWQTDNKVSILPLLRGFIPYLGSYAPIGIAARSNGPYRLPICLNM